MNTRVLFVSVLLSTLVACGGGGGGNSGGSARRLDIAVTGSGTVTAQPGTNTCSATCNFNYAANSAVTLTAAPASGQAFSSWGGACAGTTTATCTVQMDAAKSVSAIFGANTGTSFSLNVNVIGNGKVTSNPAGIDCGTQCSGDYAQGTNVTLTATPLAGHVFSGWGGACTGTAACTVSLTEARSVNATFAVISGGGTTPTYEALPVVSSRTELLDQLNQQGNRGFALIGPRGFGPNITQTDEFAYIYAKVNAATFTYEILPLPTTPDTLQTQLNEQGERGYAFQGAIVFTVGTPDTGAIYLKNNSSSATFTYALLPQKTTATDFLNQANTQGASGYFYSSGYTFTTPTLEFRNVYVREDGRDSVYEYALEATFDPSTPAQLIAQADGRGAQGFKLSGSLIFNSTDSRHLYVKDTRQSTTFQWRDLPLTTSSATFVEQANQEATTGYLTQGSFLFFPNGSADQTTVIPREMYVKPVNCNGQLCIPGIPL